MQFNGSAIRSMDTSRVKRYSVTDDQITCPVFSSRYGLIAKILTEQFPEIKKFTNLSLQHLGSDVTSHESNACSLFILQA